MGIAVVRRLVSCKGPSEVIAGQKYFKWTLVPLCLLVSETVWLYIWSRCAQCVSPILVSPFWRFGEEICQFVGLHGCVFSPEWPLLVPGVFTCSSNGCLVWRHCSGLFWETVDRRSTLLKLPCCSVARTGPPIKIFLHTLLKDILWHLCDPSYCMSCHACHNFLCFE